MTFIHIVLVSVGGFVGAIARFALSEWIKRKSVLNLPIATPIVNIVGSFLLGLLMGIRSNDLIAILVGVGFLGSFTTFSTFTLDSVQLYDRGEGVKMLFYITMNVVGSLMAVLSGILIARFM